MLSITPSIVVSGESKLSHGKVKFIFYERQWYAFFFIRTTIQPPIAEHDILFSLLLKV